MNRLFASAFTRAANGLKKEKACPAIWASRFALGSGVILTWAVLSPISSEQARPTTTDSAGAVSEEVSLLCLIGTPKSGRTTQAKRLSERFDLPIIPASSSKTLAPGLYIVDGSPATLEQVPQLPGPIWCTIFFDLPPSEYARRFNKPAKDVEKEYNALQPLVHKFREQGNILEISAHWDDPDEVWEQVEAKTESILELRERGDM